MLSVFTEKSEINIFVLKMGKSFRENVEREVSSETLCFFIMAS